MGVWKTSSMRAAAFTKLSVAALVEGGGRDRQLERLVQRGRARGDRHPAGGLEVGRAQGERGAGALQASGGGELDAAAQAVGDRLGDRQRAVARAVLGEGGAEGGDGRVGVEVVHGLDAGQRPGGAVGLGVAGELHPRLERDLPGALLRDERHVVHGGRGEPAQHHRPQPLVPVQAHPVGQLLRHQLRVPSAEGRAEGPARGPLVVELQVDARPRWPGRRRPRRAPGRSGPARRPPGGRAAGGSPGPGGSGGPRTSRSSQRSGPLPPPPRTTRSGCRKRPKRCG